jgi:hypothetical protein
MSVRLYGPQSNTNFVIDPLSLPAYGFGLTLDVCEFKTSRGGDGATIVNKSDNFSMAKFMDEVAQSEL